MVFLNSVLVLSFSQRSSFSALNLPGRGLLSVFQYPWSEVRNLFCEQNAASPLFEIPRRGVFKPTSNPVWCARGFLEAHGVQSAYGEECVEWVIQYGRLRKPRRVFPRFSDGKCHIGLVAPDALQDVEVEILPRTS